MGGIDVSGRFLVFVLEMILFSWEIDGEGVVIEGLSAKAWDVVVLSGCGCDGMVWWRNRIEKERKKEGNSERGTLL